MLAPDELSLFVSRREAIRAITGLDHTLLDPWLNRLGLRETWNHVLTLA